MSKMTSEKINEKFKKLKRMGKKFFSNVYFSFSLYPGKEWETIESDNSLIIVNCLDGVNRLLFFSLDVYDLKEMLLTYGDEAILEIPSKEDDIFLRDIILQSGFKLLASLCKVSCNDVSVIFDKDENQSYKVKGRYAEQKDAHKIYNMLWDTFDTRMSHLPHMDEIKDCIAKNEFYIVAERDDIVSLIQSKILPKSYYCNQIINRGNKKDFYLAFSRILFEYKEKGGKYAYAWVEEKNIASLRFFEKFSFTRDGMINRVYCKASKEC